MSNDPYRNDPYGPGETPGGPPGTPDRPAPEESAWSRPPPGAVPPDETWVAPSDPAAAPEPGPPPPYQTPQYQAPQYQAPQYQAPQYQAQPVPGPGPEYPGGRRPTNALAIAALVCSIAGVLTLISAPVGAVLGHLATRQIARTGEEGAPLAKAAIWVGWIITGLVVAACCAVLAVAIAAGRSGTDFGPR